MPLRAVHAGVTSFSSSCPAPVAVFLGILGRWRYGKIWHGFASGVVTCRRRRDRHIGAFVFFLAECVSAAAKRALLHDPQARRVSAIISARRTSAGKRDDAIGRRLVGNGRVGRSAIQPRERVFGLGSMSVSGGTPGCQQRHRDGAVLRIGSASTLVFSPRLAGARINAGIAASWPVGLNDDLRCQQAFAVRVDLADLAFSLRAYQSSARMPSLF